MGTRVIRQTQSPDEKVLHERIEVLTGVVNGLEERKKILDSQVNNHAATTLDYQKNQILLNEIIKDIENKRAINISVTEEMNEISQKLFLEKQELEEVKKLTDQKGLLSADIQRYSENIVSLQKDMERYQDDYKEKKRMAENDLQAVMKKMKDLHDSFTLVINNQ